MEQNSVIVFLTVAISGQRKGFDPGIRYYDSDLSVFISVDRFASKYPNLSPYHYCAGNPVNLIDINGDSTRYYYKGALLFTSYDGLKNAEVELSHLDISDAQVKIIQDAGKDESHDKKYDSDDFNKKARALGVKYYTDDYEKFYNENHGKKNKNGVVAERGFILSFNEKTLDMEMVPDVIIESQGKDMYSANTLVIDADPDVNKGKPYPGQISSHGHFHNSDNNSRNIDNADKLNYYRILINSNTITLFGKREANDIIIPKNNTYKRQ